MQPPVGRRLHNGARCFLPPAPPDSPEEQARQAREYVQQLRQQVLAASEGPATAGSEQPCRENNAP